MIIKSNFGIDEMLNEETLPCKVCINLQKSMIEVVDSEDDITEEHLVIPTVEELYPYNKCMYDFLGDDIVPKGKGNECESLFESESNDERIPCV